MRACTAALAAATAIFGGAAWAAELPSPPDALPLDRALELALEHNADLQAVRFSLDAAEGLERQAGAIPNPTLTVEVENFAGDGETRGLDSAETTVALEQRLEIGGKRALRRDRAAADRARSGTELEAARLDVVRDTRLRFFEALAAQEQVGLKEDALQLAEKMTLAAAQRVQAGKDAPVEAAKARTELARAQMDLDRARSALTVRYRALSALWGETTPGFGSVVGDLAAGLDDTPDFTGMPEALQHTPEWTWWDGAIQAAELDIQAERAARLPDVTIGAGIRQSQGDSTSAFVAGVGLDIPIFDRRSGAMAAARAARQQIQAKQAAARTALHTEWAAACEALSVARTIALTLKRQALPAAQEAFAAAETAYQAGKIGYLDAQDARRGLIEIRDEWIEALTEYRHAEASLARLLGHGHPGGNHQAERNP